MSDPSSVVHGTSKTPNMVNLLSMTDPKQTRKGLHLHRTNYGQSFLKNKTFRAFQPNEKGLNFLTTPISPYLVDSAGEIDAQTDDNKKSERTKSPMRPSIFLQDSLKFPSEQFDESVRFGPGNGKASHKIAQAKTQDHFWRSSQVDFNNQVMHMTERDK